ncbi:MAG: hypothetical protein OEN02_18630 [Gammaproteobacteria bacterium]|nr:hypothetical protein [Gammaproteobacteria bacterium]MDH3536859.1 hypothetical protein [Gammaproteobacteria bacterium]
MFDVSLRLLCTSKSGTLSRVIRELNLVGLQYQSHQIETRGDRARISIGAVGDLNCSLESLEELLGAISEVLSVEDLQISRDGKAVTEFRTRVSETRISADEHLSPAVILAAEKRLSDILGPVASVIVEAVAGNCAVAGELYTRLADELDTQEERDYFLSIIDDSH